MSLPRRREPRLHPVRLCPDAGLPKQPVRAAGNLVVEPRREAVALTRGPAPAEVPLAAVGMIRAECNPSPPNLHRLARKRSIARSITSSQCQIMIAIRRSSPLR